MIKLILSESFLILHSVGLHVNEIRQNMSFPKWVSLHYGWVILLVGTLCDGKSAIYIGGFYSSGGSWDSRQILPSMNMALDHINDNTNILPDYELKIIWNDTVCDPNMATKVLYDQLYSEPKILSILGDGCSISTRVIAANAGFWHLTTVSYAAASPSLSNREEFPYFFRTIIPDSMLNPVRIHIMKHFGWTRVAPLHGKEDIFISAVDDFKAALKEANMEVIQTSQAVTPSNVHQVIESLKNADAKIITLNMYSSRARLVFCEAYRANMTGKGYVWMILGWYRDRWWEETDNDEQQFINCTVKQLTEAVKNSYYIATEMQQLDTSGNVTDLNITADGYKKQVIEYLNQTDYRGFEYDEDGPLGYDAAWAIALMLDNVSRAMDRNLTTFSYEDTELTTRFFEVLNETYFVGVSGEVRFDSNGDRMGKIQIRQFQPCNESWYLVNDTCVKNMSQNQCSQLPDGVHFGECPEHYPLRNSVEDEPFNCCVLKAERLVAYYEDTNNGTWIWRGNFTWPGGVTPGDRTPPERVHEIPRKYYLPIYIIASLGILLCVFLFAFNTIHRNKRFIKLSSPGMNNLIILGGLMTYLVVFPLSLENREDKSVKSQETACRASFCLAALGFLLGFGSMITKTWRVYKVAVFKVPKRVVIKNRRLYVIVGALFAVDAIIVSIVCYFTTLRRLPVESSGGRNITMFFEHCEIQYEEFLLVILYGFNSILVVFGIFLAWQTRKVTIDGLNDSKIIGLCIYNLALVFTVQLLYLELGEPNPAISFVVTSTISFYWVTFTLVILFVPKIKSVVFDGDSSPNTSSPSNTNDTASVDTVDDLRDMLNQAQSEIKRLKEVNQNGGQGNDPHSGCGIWCFGAVCGCCTSPEVWKESTATLTKNQTSSSV